MSEKPHIPPKPPRLASRLLEWYCKPSLYEDLQGDLLEYFEKNVEKRGAAFAKLVYVVDVLKFSGSIPFENLGFSKARITLPC